MAERAEDLDYEPDVLKFKQIWNEMKETTHEKVKGHNKEVNSTSSAVASKQKNKKSKNPEQPKQHKKGTIISNKNVTRNPKNDHQKVIEVVTRPEGSQQQSLKHHKNFIKKDEYVQHSNAPTLQNRVSSLERAVEEKDYQLSLLRNSNTRYEDRIRVLEN